MAEHQGLRGGSKTGVMQKKPKHWIHPEELKGKRRQKKTMYRGLHGSKGGKDWREAGKNLEEMSKMVEPQPEPEAFRHLGCGLSDCINERKVPGRLPEVLGCCAEPTLPRQPIAPGKWLRYECPAGNNCPLNISLYHVCIFSCPNSEGLRASVIKQRRAGSYRVQAAKSLLSKSVEVMHVCGKIFVPLTGGASVMSSFSIRSVCAYVATSTSRGDVISLRTQGNDPGNNNLRAILLLLLSQDLDYFRVLAV